MKPILDYIKEFEFKNLFAAGLAFYMLYLLASNTNLRDVLTVFLTLIIKHFYDSNTSAVKQTATISNALENAQANAGSPTIEKATTVNFPASPDTNSTTSNP